MDAEYSMICMADFGELTPLEVAVMYTHPKAYEMIRRQVDLDRLVDSKVIGPSLYALWRRSNPVYRHLSARLALSTFEEYHGNIARYITTGLAGVVSDLRGGTTMSERSPFYSPPGIARGLLELDIQEGHTDFPSMSRAVDFMFESIKSRIMQQTPQVIQAAMVEPQGAAALIAEEEATIVTYQTYTDRICTNDVIRHDAALAGIDDPTPDQALTLAAARNTRILVEYTACDDAIGEGPITTNTFRNSRPIENPATRRVVRRHEVTERKKVSMGRRALRRAYAFFMDHERESELRLFIGGNCVEVSHEDSDLKFVFKRNAHMKLEKSSVQHSNQWANIDVSILTKTDVFLCDLCVYIRDTPVLDQLMALIMMVEAGLEEQLIEKGNTKRVSREVNFDEMVLKSDKLKEKLKRYHVPWVGANTVADFNNMVMTPTEFDNTYTYYSSFIEGHYNTITGFINTWIVNSSTNSTVNTYRSMERTTSINTLHNTATRAVYWRAVRNAQTTLETTSNEQTQALPV